MLITLVTPWGTACGIAEHSFYLTEALKTALPDLTVQLVDNLHPDAVLGQSAEALGDWVWLNYHAALHSQWQPEHVRHVQAKGVQVGITYHDTGVPNSEQCRALHAVADAFVVHEPAEDLPGAHYIRQGVPSGVNGLRSWHVDGWRRAYPDQPIVGTVGFPFGWKNYDLLVEAAARAGWACLLIAPTTTPEQHARWHQLHLNVRVIPDFLAREEVLTALSGCDATAFLYNCVNTGTSGAIRLGIAARKPVLASHPSICRQFRDLEGEPGIQWLTDLSVDGVARALSWTPIQRVDPRVVYLARRDCWAGVGQRYAQILRGTR